jgi:RNAse (barnase) inhibitor barstar
MSRGADMSAEPPVRPLRGMDPERLREQSEAKGRRFVRIDLSGARDRKAAFREIGRGLALPEWFGANLDALYDALADLELDAAGIDLLIERWPAASVFDAADRKELLDVFRDAAALCEERGIALRVYYR